MKKNMSYLFATVIVVLLVVLIGSNGLIKADNDIPPIETHEPNKYDVYYILHGKVQEKDPLCNFCETPKATREKIQTQCITDVQCALKLGLQAGLRSIEDYLKQDFPDISGPKEIRDENGPMVNIRLSNIYGTNYKDSHDNEFLQGEWELQSYRVNDAPVWRKKDDYDRDLILFKYGNIPREKRWLIGTDVNSDAGYAYASSDCQHPMELGSTWLHFHAASQSWMPLINFRFSPPSSEKPQIQSVAPHWGAKKVSPLQTIEIQFTHPLEPGDGFVQIEWEEIQTGKKHIERLQIGPTSKETLEIRGDRLLIFADSLQIAPNARVSVTLSPNTVHSYPKEDNNGIMEMANCVSYTTTDSGINWKVISEAYLRRAFELSEKKLWLVYILRAALNLDDDRAPLKKVLLHLKPLQNFLDSPQIKNNNSLEYVYLRGHRHLLEGYAYLFENSNVAMDSIDKALMLCLPNTTNTDMKRSKTNSDLLHNIAEGHCPHPFFDTYYRLPGGYYGNRLPDHFIRHYFPKAVRLQIFAREYIRRHPDDLSILFDIGYDRRYQWDAMKYRAQMTALVPSKVDILLGTRNIELARKEFATKGAVLLKNVLSPLECELLSKYFSDAVRRGYPESIADYDSGLVRSVFNSDRVSFLWLTELNELMSAIVGRPVKKAYSFMCGYKAQNNTRRPWLLGHTDREDNEYTFSLTLTHDGSKSAPFPLYAHMKRMVSRRKNYQFPKFEEVLEFVNDIGDALIFKGRQHIHFRTDMPKSLETYWTILFHYVPLEFEFSDFKQRQERNPDL